MKVGMDHVGQITDEKLRFFRQMGVEGIMVNPEAGDTKGYFDYTDLLLLKTRLETYGLKIGSVGASAQWSWNYKWMLGLPGRDEQIENWIKTLRNMGKAGIPLLQYNIMINDGAWLPIWRTSADYVGRGGTRIVRFDYEFARNAPLTSLGEISDNTMWDNLTYFLKAIVPVAEEAGVKLALHPCDPQVPKLAGIPRIIRSIESYELNEESNFSKIKTLSKILIEKKIDIIHTHNSGPLLNCIILSKLLNKPLVHTKHGAYIHKDKKNYLK